MPPPDEVIDYEALRCILLAVCLMLLPHPRPLPIHLASLSYDSSLH